MNMKLSRKILTFGLFLLFISGLVLLGALRQEKEQIAKPSSTKTTNINFPKESKSNLSMKVNNNSKLQTPTTLPQISIKLKEIDKNESTEIAEGLGFSNEMKSLEDYREGIKYLWSNEKTHLLVTPNKSYFRYGMNQFPTNTEDKKISDNDIKSIAFNFVTDKFNLDKNKIEISSISYYKLAQKSEGFSETTKDESQLFHIDLIYKDIGYPVLTTIPKFQVIYVEILPNGEIYTACAYIIDEINKSQEDYAVKSFDDIKDSLDEAHLISVENDYIYLIDIDQDDIKNIDVEKIEVGYYFDDINMDTTLQPIFLLEGEVEIKDSTADWAKLYMPALK